MQKLQRLLLVSLLVINSSACVGFVVGQTADAAIAVGKVPFKVGGAIVEGVISDDDEEKKDQDK